MLIRLASCRPEPPGVSCAPLCETGTPTLMTRQMITAMTKMVSGLCNRGREQGRGKRRRRGAQGKGGAKLREWEETRRREGQREKRV